MGSRAASEAVEGRVRDVAAVVIIDVGPAAAPSWRRRAPSPPRTSCSDTSRSRPATPEATATGPPEIDCGPFLDEIRQVGRGTVLQLDKVLTRVRLPVKMHPTVRAWA
jgi:hypothetical protein